MNTALLYARLKDAVNKYKTDFLMFTATGIIDSWYASALATGTLSALTPTVKHQGIVAVTSHATNANSGYKIMSALGAIMLGGKEKATFIFKTAPTQGSGTSEILCRLGFLDTADHSAPTDGVYCKLADDTGKHYITGQTANNTTASTTATKYAVASNTWYRLVIEINSNASLATFTLYEDNSTNVLWTDTLATNIPTTRETGHGYVCTLAASSGAIVIGSLDYMDIVLPNARRVV